MLRGCEVLGLRKREGNVETIFLFFDFLSSTVSSHECD